MTGERDDVGGDGAQGDGAQGDGEGDDGPDVDEVVEAIEAVEIQGASAIARAGVELLRDLDAAGAGRAELEAAAARLQDARPTEPFLSNAVAVAVASGDYGGVLDHVDEARERIVAIGRGRVDEGDVVYTHCHSSTVTAPLLAAWEDGVRFEVHVTETRPLYQGRETARELASAGIPVTMFVDSGGRLALKDADAMLIGADAVQTDGRVINKIGSELLAEAAERHGVPVDVYTDSWKLDPATRFGFSTEIEERAAEEVWPDPPEGVEIQNYAFERVHPDRIRAVVSELGVHPPRDFVEETMETYPELTAGEDA